MSEEIEKQKDELYLKLLEAMKKRTDMYFACKELEPTLSEEELSKRSNLFKYLCWEQRICEVEYMKFYEKNIRH